MEPETRADLLAMKLLANQRADLLDYAIDTKQVDEAAIPAARQRLLDWRQRAIDLSRVLDANPVTGMQIVLNIDGDEEAF